VNLDGQSFFHQLLEKKSIGERTIFHHCASEVFAMRKVFDGNKVYKLILKEPIVDKNGRCPEDICPCYGPMIRQNQPPLLYDIVNDPTESSELDPTSSLYREISSLMLMDLHQFQQDIEANKMPSQYTTLAQVMPMPWLQPYLNV